MRRAARPAPARTPLVAAGFLAGAVIGALPPVHDAVVRWQCAAAAGTWVAAARACEYRMPIERGLPASAVRELPVEGER